LRKISTESNVADVLTKLIVSKAFTIKAMHLLGKMGIKIDMNIYCEQLSYEQE
jgi:HD-like signal output (HDOD) protein